MKKVLLIGFVLAILLLAFPQGVMAAVSDGDSAIVTATIADYIDLVVTGPSTWGLTYTATQCAIPSDYTNCNQLTNAISFDISSNDGWALSVLGDNTGNQGFLRSSGTGAASLQRRFLIGPDSSSNYVTVETTKQLHIGVLGDTVPFTKNLQQTLAITDDATKTYTLTLVFDATTTT